MKKQTLIIGFLLMAFSFSVAAQEAETKADPDLATFQLENLVGQLEETGRPWLPFMKGKNVLTGIYHLKSGAEDKQQPHDTDEVYYVASGKAKFKAGDETVEIKSGSILFVKAEVSHHFFDIEEDLVLVVFFDQ